MSGVFAGRAWHSLEGEFASSYASELWNVALSCCGILKTLRRLKSELFLMSTMAGDGLLRLTREEINCHCREAERNESPF